MLLVRDSHGSHDPADPSPTAGALASVHVGTPARRPQNSPFDSAGRTGVRRDRNLCCLSIPPSRRQRARGDATRWGSIRSRQRAGGLCGWAVRAGGRERGRAGTISSRPTSSVLASSSLINFAFFACCAGAVSHPHPPRAACVHARAVRSVQPCLSEQALVRLGHELALCLAQLRCRRLAVLRSRADAPPRGERRVGRRAGIRVVQVHAGAGAQKRGTQDGKRDRARSVGRLGRDAEAAGCAWPKQCGGAPRGERQLGSTGGGRRKRRRHALCSRARAPLRL